MSQPPHQHAQHQPPPKPTASAADPATKFDAGQVTTLEHYERLASEAASQK